MRARLSFHEDRIKATLSGLPNSAQVLRELLKRLDAVCNESGQLSRQVHQAMVNSTRQDQQLLSKASPQQRRASARQKKRR